MRRPTTLAIALVSVLALTAACGGGGGDSPQEAAERAAREAAVGDIDFDFDDDSFTMEGDNGAISIGGCTDLPDGFPDDDVPLPDGDPDSCSRSSFDGNDSFTFSYVLEDGDVLSDYRSALDAAGFEITNEYESQTDGETFVSFNATGDDWSVVVNANSGTGAAGDDAYLTINVFPSMDF